MKLLSTLLLAFIANLVVAQELGLNTKDEQWRAIEEQRARGLINQQHDFSPIDEAFALKEADLLFSYYSLAKNRQYGYPRWSTPEEIQKTQYTPEQRAALNLEVQKRAEEKLKQLPGLPRYLGDRIETVASEPRKDLVRRAAFDCLTLIGDDESIVELGRFLFDDRNHGFVGHAPAGSYGFPSPIKYDAAAYLEGVLRHTPGIAADIKATAPSAPGWFERAQNWWLHSDEAAPYRRKLADSGYVLPPGYPLLPELKGAKSTIASTSPSVVKPSDTDGSQTVASSSLQADAEKKPAGWHGWFLILLFLALLAVPVSLVRRKKQG